MNFLFTINTLITFYICVTNPILTLLHTFDSIHIVTENMNPVTPCLQLPCPPFHTDRQDDWIQRHTWGSPNNTDMDSRSPGTWHHTEWQILTDVSEILATSTFRVLEQLSTHFHTTYGSDNNCNKSYYKYMRTLLALQDHRCPNILTGSKSKRCVPPLVYLQLPSLKKCHTKLRSQFSISMESSLEKCREDLVI